MIKSFRHKGLKRFFESGNRSGIHPELAPRIRRLLDAIDTAEYVFELNLPGYDLHELKGDRRGTWALKVNKNRRITFRFVGDDGYDVDLEDYH